MIHILTDNEAERQNLKLRLGNEQVLGASVNGDAVYVGLQVYDMRLTTKPRARLGFRRPIRQTHKRRDVF